MRCLAMECLFSYQFFQQVWRHAPAQLLILPAPAGRTSWLQSPRKSQMIMATSVAELASSYGIPVFYMARWSDLLPQLVAGEPLLTACFPRRVPTTVLVHAPIYNIHPSLLPDLRGPDPLFYVARGDAPAGVTIHQMDAQFDTGPIITQQLIDITNCASEADLIRLHAQVAATNWLALTTPLSTGTPQPQLGTNAPLPQATDYVLDASWSRQRTQRFMQLTNLRRHPYWVPVLHQWVSGLHPFGTVEIPCADGYLRADVVAAPSGVVLPHMQ
jgi:methionyl-tRNA formyltransferase